MAEHHKHFWTQKRKERALAFGLGTALLIIIWLLLRKHLVGDAAAPGSTLGISGAPVSGGSLNPTFTAPAINAVWNLNGGSVSPASLVYKPGDFSVFYPALANPDRGLGCCCGCDENDAKLSNTLADNMNRYMVGLTGAENYYIDSVYGNIAPAIRQYIGNTDTTTLTSNGF